jgi:nucleoside-diphosphate-sugar epimerase
MRTSSVVYAYHEVVDHEVGAEAGGHAVGRGVAQKRRAERIVRELRDVALGKAAGVPRFIFASSCSNYGAAGDDFLDESSAFNPVTPYGESIG